MRLVFDKAEGLNVLVVNKKELKEAYDQVFAAVKQQAINGKIKVCLTGLDEKPNAPVKGNVPYAYDKTEYGMLIELNTLLELHGVKNGLIFSESYDIAPEPDFSNCWRLSEVLQANRTIDEQVARIKNAHLTPLEAMLYIHAWATSFKYAYNHDRDKRERNATILGLNEELVGLCCVGYSSLVKVMVEKLGIKDSLDAQQCCVARVKKGSNFDKLQDYSMHSLNFVKIEDKEYDVKGVYIEDSTHIKSDDYSDTPSFAHFLIPFQDYLHKSNHYYQFQSTSPKNSVSHGFMFDEIIANFSAIPLDERPTAVKQIFEFIPGMNHKTHEFEKNVCPPIPLDTLEMAGRNAMVKLGYPKDQVEERLASIMQRSVQDGGAMFTADACNCFADTYHYTNFTAD